MLWTNQNIILFHGTDENSAKSIRDTIMLEPEIANVSPDFGRGFYTTTNENQANIGAKFKATNRNETPEVVKFSVPREKLAKLSILSFARADKSADDYWFFVQHCRESGNHSVTGNWYDIVIGPVALNWNKRVSNSSYDQISFHTQKAIGLIEKHVVS